MSSFSLQQLSRRERQIMEILYEHQACSAQDIQDHLPDPPSYSAVRALLARLVEKDVVQYRQEGARYIYFPKVAEKKAQQSALSRLLKTFFKGSPAQAASALLDMDADAMTAREIEELERKIKQLKARKNNDD